MGIPFELNIEPSALFSKSTPDGKLAKLAQFPLSRIFIVAAFLAPIFLVNALIIFLVIEAVGEPLATYIDMLRMAVSVLALLFCYKLYCRVIEKRSAPEVSVTGGGREWAAGFLFAATVVVLMVAVISVFGSFSILEYRSVGTLSANFLLFSMGALLQDMVLLLVIFRLAEEYAGTWIALITSLLLFGAVHAINPNQTLGTTLMLVFSSVIIIVPFILTRRIWLSWGFHAGWNFMQAGVFGMANSGIMFTGWMVTSVDGPTWLTGGAVGIEGSYLALGIDVAVGLLLLLVAINSGKLVQARWNRSRD